MSEKTQRNSSLIQKFLKVQPASAPAFSPSGHQLTLIMNMNGVAQVWSVEHKPGMREVLWPEQKTFSPERVQGYWHSPCPGKGFIFAGDRGGSERSQLFFLDEDTGAEVPLTEGYEKSTHGFGSWSPDGSFFLFYCNRRHPGYFDLYRQALGEEAQLIWQNDTYGMIGFVVVSLDGKTAIVNRLQSTFCHDLLQIDLENGSVRNLAPRPGNIRYNRAALLPDAKTLLIATDVDSEYIHLARLDLKSLDLQDVISHPHDIDHFVLSKDGRQVFYDLNLDGYNDLYRADLDSRVTHKAPLPADLQGVSGDISPFIMNSGFSLSPDSQFLAFTFSTPVCDSNVYLWDLAQDQVYPVTRAPMAGLCSKDMRAPRLVTYPSFDGRQIPGLLYTPGATPGEGFPRPWPVVVIVHGGPAGQSRFVFNFFAQALLKNGFAVFLPNVRGSNGYGKTYTQLDEVEKRMDSVSDLAYAARWLKNQPDFDGERLAVYGASYGGFMVLASLTHHADLWAAGIDLVGQANFVTFLENTSEYRRAHREAEYGSLKKDREFLESIAPMNHLNKVRAPLMVIHGENDPRVPLSETLKLIEELESRHIPVEKMIFPDEGHGIAKDANKQTAYPAMLDFFARHLQR